jgi:anaerobic selenocysteine-containing dehydrogenase
VPLRLGLLTSWNTRCGIAEYSRHLATAMRRRGDVDVTVFGSRNFGERAVREYEDWAVPTFDVQMWHPEHRLDLDVETVLDREPDVLHVQYSNLFYNRRRLVELLRRFPGLTALTYHDKRVSRAFPERLPDVLYAHREDVGTGPRRLIPQGVDLRRPVIKTFGLGRSRADVIEELCARNGWAFEQSFGEQRWLESDELFAWLRDSDAIVLWYDEDESSGGSAAAPLAIGTRRPVFVNDTEWFRDLPERTGTLRKVSTPEQLEAGLRELLTDPYAEERSWDRVADTLVRDYRAAIAEGAAGRQRSTHGARAFVALDHKPFSLRKHRLRSLGRRRPAHSAAPGG